MQYVVARINKINSGSPRSCAAHIDRRTLTPNADPEKTPENKTVGGKDINAEQAVQEIINDYNITPRKNGVLAIETVISVSRTFFFDKHEKLIPTRVAAFTRAAIDELSKEQHLGKLAKAVLHLDEMTPHIHALSVPITPDGRLCAKHYLEHRQKYRDFQTAMGGAFRDLGVWRGVPNKRSTHQKVRDFYKVIDKDIDFCLDWKKAARSAALAGHEEAQQKYQEKFAAAVIEQVRDDVRVMEVRAGMAENERSRRYGAEWRIEWLQHLIHQTTQLWETEKSELKQQNDNLISSVEGKDAQISQLQSHFTAEKKVTKNLKKQLIKSEARLKDFPISKMMAHRKMTHRVEGEKTIYLTGDKPVFVKVDEKLFASNQMEVKTAIEAYVEINIAQNRPDYVGKTIDTLKVFRDFAQEFGERYALAATLFHNQARYHAELEKMRVTEAEKQQQQILAGCPGGEKVVGCGNDTRQTNDREDSNYTRQAAQEQQRRQEQQTQAISSSIPRGQEEREREEQDKQQMRGRVR